MLPNFKSENGLQFCAWILIGVAVISFICSFFLTTPYGRYSRYSWGFGVNARLAWLLQESPSFLIPFAMFVVSGSMKELMSFNLSPNAVLLFMFMVHYFRRYVVAKSIFRHSFQN